MLTDGTYRQFTSSVHQDQRKLTYWQDDPSAPPRSVQERASIKIGNELPKYPILLDRLRSGSAGKNGYCCSNEGTYIDIVVRMKAHIDILFGFSCTMIPSNLTGK